jgi:solute carrier family 6 amino acid transporter-like protein 5/7/9/14
VVLVANAATSIFSGFVIFAIIGYLAQELDLEVHNVVDEGVGLAFMVIFN